MKKVISSRFLGNVILASVFLLTIVARADIIEGEPVTKTIERSGKNLDDTSYLETSLTTKNYRITFEEKTVEIPVYDCEKKTINSRAGNWHGFFQDNEQEQKPARLAAAIKGLDLINASQLIEEGFLNKKPRSWSEFQREIEKASEKLGGHFEHYVLVAHKETNIKNLGYYIKNCSKKVIKKQRTVPVRVFEKEVTRDFLVRFRKAPLLEGEIESFTLCYDGINEGAFADSSYYKYDVDRWVTLERAAIEFLGKRKLVVPTNSLRITAKIAKQQIELEIEDLSFDADVAWNTKQYLVGEIKHTVPGIWRNTTRHLCDFEIPLSREEAKTVDSVTRVVIPKSGTLTIFYRLKINRSSYHSNNPSSSRSIQVSIK